MYTGEQGCDGCGVEKGSMAELLVILYGGASGTADRLTDAADDEQNEQEETDQL